MKGQAQPGAAMTNQYEMTIIGLPAIYFTRIGELSRELILADMPDRTRQSTGAVTPGDFDGDVLVHHALEMAALEALHRAAETGTPLGKTTAILAQKGADAIASKATWQIVGLICKGRATPELSSGDDGSPVVCTWSFSYDDIVYLG